MILKYVKAQIHVEAGTPASFLESGHVLRIGEALSGVDLFLPGDVNVRAQFIAELRSALDTAESYVAPAN